MNLDRGLKGIADYIRSVIAPVDYYASYACTVIYDHGDMTVDLEPDSPKLAKMTRIPVANVLPSCRVKVQRGARVMLTFQDGRADKPQCTVWEQAALQWLEIDTGQGQRIRIDTVQQKIIVEASLRVEVRSSTQVDMAAPLVTVNNVPVAKVGDKTSAGGVILPA